MSIEFNIDIAELRLRLNAKTAQIVKAITGGLQAGMRLYEGHVLTNMMSGRRRPDYGLNVRTGTLRRSWRVKTKGTTLDDYAVSLATGTKYARIHQFGGKAGRNHAASIPKRLYILEDFPKLGVNLISQQLKIRIRTLATQTL